MEVWKPVVDYENLYEVNNYGDIRSLYSKKKNILKPYINRKGYKVVTLCKNGEQKTLLVHRLVAKAFIPNPDNLPCINHKDENGSNNNVSNLEWCSYLYNNTYGTRLTKHITKISKPVRCIETGVVYSSACSAQRETGIRQGDISQCCHHQRKSTGGYTWEFI